MVMPAPRIGDAGRNGENDGGEHNPAHAVSTSVGAK
jgi:hypothetical protein